MCPATSRSAKNTASKPSREPRWRHVATSGKENFVIARTIGALSSVRTWMSAAAVAACLFAPATASAASSRVAALQVALRAHNAYSGAVDGIAGPATTAGVRRIQARAGLAVDGIVGPAHAPRARPPGPPFGRQPPAAPGPSRVGRRRAAVRARDPRLPVRDRRRRLRRPHGGGRPPRAGVRRPARRRRRRPGDARRALPPAGHSPGAAPADPSARSATATARAAPASTPASTSPRPAAPA